MSATDDDGARGGVIRSTLQPARATSVCHRDRRRRQAQVSASNVDGSATDGSEGTGWHGHGICTETSKSVHGDTRQPPRVCNQQQRQTRHAPISGLAGWIGAHVDVGTSDGQLSPAAIAEHGQFTAVVAVIAENSRVTAPFGGWAATRTNTGTPSPKLLVMNDNLPAIAGTDDDSPVTVIPDSASVSLTTLEMTEAPVNAASVDTWIV